MCEFAAAGTKRRHSNRALAHAMRDHTHRPQPAERDRTRVRGLARQGEAGFGFALDGNGRRDPAASGSTTRDVQQREDADDRAE